MRDNWPWLRKRLRERLAALVTFLLVAEVVVLVLLSPLSAGLLSLFLNKWGRCSIGNFEVAAFLLSPTGALAALLVGTVATATLYFQLAGIMLLLAGPGMSVLRVLGELAGQARRIARLALRQLAILLLTAAPFVIAASIVLRTLWQDHDLNGLLVLKPPIFWVGAACAAILLAGFVTLGGWLVLRWFIALPLLLADPDATPRQVLVASAAASAGRRKALLAGIGGWLILQLAVGAAVTVPLAWTADAVLDRVGLGLAVLLPVTGLFVLAHVLVAAALSMFGLATFGGLMLACWRACGGTGLAADHVARTKASWAIVLTRPRMIALVTLGVIISLTVSALLLAGTRLVDGLEITAHRGGALLAPENTVAAIRAAIAARADWAEIDVQRSADGQLVVIHDFDLRRVGGLTRRVEELTLAELQRVNVGRSFGGGFEEECIPTLEEIIAAAGDAIRLNIELKPHGPSDVDPLTRGVVTAARAGGILARCRICSQSYEGIQLARELAPEVEIGFIVGAAIGDLARLDVDFLMVNAPIATRRLTDAARARGMQVHAWTVNNPEELVPLLDRGVANVITDDPFAMRARLEEVRDLDPASRLLLRTRGLLAD